MILGPLMDPIQGETIRIIKEPGATGTTRRSVQNAISVPESFNFFIQMDRRENGERRTADFTFACSTLTLYHSLVRPGVRLVLVFENARSPTMLFLRAGYLVGPGAMHLDYVKLLRGEVRSPIFPITLRRARLVNACPKFEQCGLAQVLR